MQPKVPYLHIRGIHHMGDIGQHGDDEDRLGLEEAGIFTWTLETNIVQADTAVARLFGLPQADVVAGLPVDRFLARIHPIDRPKVAKSIHSAIVTGGPYHEVYTVMGQEGSSDVVAFGRCFRDANGEPSMYAGIVYKAADGANEVDPMVSHIARAHKLAVEAGRVEVADALESILEELSRGRPVNQRVRH